MQHTSRKAWLAAITLFSAFLSATAFAQTKTIEEIVAWVNADVILKSEYEARRAAIRAELAAPAERRGKGLQGAQLEQVFNEQSKSVLQQLIDEALVLQQAKDMGLSAAIEVTKTKDRLRQEQKLDSMEALDKAIVEAGYNLADFEQNIRVQYLWEEVMRREVYPRMTITNEEGRKYYEAHVKDFDRPAGIHLREITILTDNRSPEGIEQQRKKAEEALAAVKKGDDFAQTAAKFSESDTASSGGDLGFYTQGQLNETFAPVAEKLDKGQVSDILTLPGAFMIIKVDDKHNGGVLPYELAQKEVFDKLWGQAVPGKIREYLTKLRSDGFVRTADGYVDLGAPDKSAPKSPDKSAAKD